MIFVLIAATATPLYLLLLQGPWKWSMFIMLWGTAAAGMGWKLYGLETPQWITTTIYLFMSWLLLIAIWPSLSLLKPEAWTWFLIGAFFYTLGAFIDLLERPNPWPKWFGFHEIFHILAMLGTVSHFWLFYKYFIALG
jgi:hemolysin III